MMNALQKFYGILVCCGSKLQCPVLLIIRLIWGFQFFQAGLGKFQNMERTVNGFTGIGIPLPAFNAYLVASTEFLGGLLLILGLASRLASLPLAFAMCVAFATAHKDQLLALFSDSEKFFAAPPLPFLLGVLTVLAFGPGKISLDYLISRFLPLKKP